MDKNQHSKQWIRDNETFAIEETLFKTLNFENSPIDSTMNPYVELDDSSSSYWWDQKQVQQNSENLESIIQKLSLPVKISVFSKVIPKWLTVFWVLICTMHLNLTFSLKLQNLQLLRARSFLALR